MSSTSTPACQTVLTNISAYLDGELDATACDEIERHCQTCPECREVVDSLRETIGLCRNIAQAPLPTAIRQRARDRVRQLLERSATQR